MSRTYRGESCFLVDDNPTNSLLIDGLNGGYAYPQGEITEATTPVKDNFHDHLQDCYDKETEVLTESGWKPFAQAVPTEGLATVNLQTDLIEYQLPTQLIAKQFDGEMVQLKHQALDLLVTPTHRMVTYVRRTKDPDVPEIKFACDLTIWDRLKLHASWLGEEPNPIILPKSGMRDQCEIDPHIWAAFLGWYVSEGWHSKTVRTPGSGYAVGVCQNVGWKREKMRAVLTQTPWTWQENKFGFYTSSKQLWEYVHPLGNVYTKCAPDWIRAQSPTIIQAFIDAAVLGDGWKVRGEGRWQYATVSKSLADTIQELVIKTGKSASIIIRKAAPYHIGEQSGTNTKDQYWVSLWSRDKISLRDSHNNSAIHVVNYTGMVYCATVPNGTLIVRRNGKPLIAGNCVRYLAVNFGANPNRTANRAAFDLAAKADILERKVYAY
jgi:hypothetical protein